MIVTGKQEKAKALMAEAEQNPKTIAEQRQEEAIAQIQQEQSRTLGDLTQQTAGTLNTQNAARKRGMNKLMQKSGKFKYLSEILHLAPSKIGGVNICANASPV